MLLTALPASYPQQLPDGLWQPAHPHEGVFRDDAVLEEIILALLV